MELYLLRYFLAVVETGSFTKAADQCLITQPTLSAGIKRLEAELGVMLFVRNAKRVFLTEAGSRFLIHAKRILHECNLATAELAETGRTPILRLGVLHTLPAVTVARLISGFAAIDPHIRFELFDGTEQELQNRLDERGIDFALSLKNERDQGIALFEEGYSLAMATTHRLAGEAVLNAQALADEHMIVRSRCEMLSETSRFFTDRNVRPRLVYRTGNDERAMEMIGAGVGITLMPDSYRADNVVRIPLEHFTPRRVLALFPPAFTLPSLLNEAAATFTAHTRAFFQKK